MALNTTTASSATPLFTPLLGAILIFAVLAAFPKTAEAQTDACSDKQGLDYYNCRYCNDLAPSADGQLFSVASANRISQKNTLECRPRGDSIAEANAPAPTDGMWSNSIAERRQACLGKLAGTSVNVGPGQTAEQVERNLENQLQSSWSTSDGKVCKANANQDCQDYATAAFLITNTWADKYGGDACFFQGQYLNPQGPNGPRWSKKWQDHYDWCVAQTDSGNLQAVIDERNNRLQAIDYCQQQNGQPYIDKTTAQPLPPPPPTQRTRSFAPPMPVPPAATDGQSTVLGRNPPNPIASGSGGGSGILTTNPSNPFGSGSGSGSGSGRPNTNTGGYDTSTSTPQSRPPTVTTNPPNPFGSGSGSGRPNTNTGGSYPSQPQPRAPAGSGGSSGRPSTNTGGFDTSTSTPQSRPPTSTTNSGNPAGSGGSSGRPNTNTGGSNPPKTQPQPPKNPVVTTNRPNPFATPTNTTNVRSFTQTHAERSKGGGSSKQYRRYSPHGGHHNGSHHGSSHHGGGHHSGGHHGGSHHGSHHSDIRLKHDITLLGRLDNGLGFYRFSYNGSNKVYVGVMAQEVQAVLPMAVERGRDGYLLVRYPELGLQFQTYEQWIASGAHVPSGPPLQH